MSHKLNSRGDAFNNKDLLSGGSELINRLHELVSLHEMKPKFLISTIMPRQWLTDLESNNPLSIIFKNVKPEMSPLIYYSLYSLNKDFRKEWIPNAVDYKIAFEWLQNYQNTTNQNIKLHWALIKDKNDSEKEIQDIIDFIKISYPKLKFGINLVRYNPYSVKSGEESTEEVVQLRLEQLRTAFPESKIKMVERVGRDVAASCGMFSNKNGIV